MKKTDAINIFQLNYPVIKKAILYGSKARGDFLENSDINLLLITEGSVPIQTKYQVFDIIYKKE